MKWIAYSSNAITHRDDTNLLVGMVQLRDQCGYLSCTCHAQRLHIGNANIRISIMLQHKANEWVIQV